jgi:small subunit ribosomal protein S2
MKALLETGVHFGHRTRKWNPAMKPFIFTERNGIHIIDLQQTVDALEKGYALVRDVAAGGASVLFVGTKRQAQETMEAEAMRCGMPFVNTRWLGGTLTNWRTIRSRIDELTSLEKARDAGEFEKVTKKEALGRNRKIQRLQARLGGVRTMRSLPSLLFVVDVRREETAIHEANLLKIPVLALVDTNCDPRGVDHVIPSNDDAIRAIKLLTAKIADAVLEGRALRKDLPEDEEAGVPADELRRRETAVEPEMTDADLLGEATLAKLQSGEFDEDQALARAEAAKLTAPAEGEKPPVEGANGEKPAESPAPEGS